MQIEKIGKRALKGSPSRDEFKYFHKQPPMPRCFYATDLDFLFVEKNPPRIAAAVDYKKNNRDGITFAECIAYNDLMQHYPLYIVVGEAPFDTLDIYQYEGGDFRPEPPKVELRLVRHCSSQQEFIEWQREVRRWTG